MRISRFVRDNMCCTVWHATCCTDCSTFLARFSLVDWIAKLQPMVIAGNSNNPSEPWRYYCTNEVTSVWYVAAIVFNEIKRRINTGSVHERFYALIECIHTRCKAV